MIPRGLARRYARALLNAAVKEGNLGDVFQDATGFRQVLADNPRFQHFLMAPQTLLREKKDILEATIGGKASKLFSQFLLLLLDKKRFSSVNEIIEAFEWLYEQHEGIVEAKVTTAVELDKSMTEKLRKKLETETKKKIRLMTSVDEGIIGGMVVTIGDKIIDGSIRYQMEKLKRDLDEIRIGS